MPSVADPVAAEHAAPRQRPIAVTVGVGILTVIAVVAALYLARAFFVPLLIGILASYALRPLVDWLKARRIPRAVGAALVLVVLVSGASWVAVSMEDGAASLIEKLPEAARQMRRLVGETRAAGPTTLQNIQEAATEIQGAAADAAERVKPARSARPLATARQGEPSPWLRDYMLAQSALLFTVAAQAPIVLLLAYFLLASGEHFRRKLVQLVGPSLTRKKDAVRILEEIDTQIQRYLLATLGSNVLVGIGTWLALEALGMEQAGAWGVAAGVLHFIPYLGPILVAFGSGVAAFMQFGTAVSAFTVAGADPADRRRGRIRDHDRAAEPHRARERGGAVHRIALLWLALGLLGLAPRSAVGGDRQGSLRPRRDAQARRRASRSLALCADRQTAGKLCPNLLGSQRRISTRPTRGTTTMNWDRIEGNWKQFKGDIKKQWGKLTDDQLDVIAGHRDHLAGKIQEAYGITKEETEKQVSAWQSRQKETILPK